MSNGLTISKRLRDLESEITNGLRSSGRALAAILDEELYLETHDTFDQYCRDRWGYGKSYSYQLIKNVKTLDNVSGIVENPESRIRQSHISEVSKAPEKQQAQIVATVLQRCESEKREPTAKDFRAEVKQYVADTERDEPPRVEKPVPTVRQQVAEMRSMARQHRDRLIRLIDDANERIPFDQHEELEKLIHRVGELLTEWKV